MCNCKCGHKGMCTVSKIAKILLIIGGLNWGLVGIGMLMGIDLNIVKLIFESFSAVEALIYVLVGVSAIMKIFGCKCKTCMAGCTCDTAPSKNASSDMGM